MSAKRDEAVGKLSLVAVIGFIALMVVLATADETSESQERCVEDVVSARDDASVADRIYVRQLCEESGR